MQKQKTLKQISKNTFWLVLFQFAKMFFPFLILPILTRRLLVSTYGDITFVKTIMNFMQIFVDFGFMVYGTKKITKLGKNHQKISQTLSDVILARLFLAFLAFLILLILTCFLPILRQNFLFACLSFVPVFLSIFLLDFLFRGLEIIHIMTIRFILMKTISTIFTILLVHHDQDILMIPLLDIISSFFAIFLVLLKFKELGLCFIHPRIKQAFASLKSSFVYFLSDIASTTFNALSILVIGINLSSEKTALFGISIQIIGSVQALFGQLAGGIYPMMVRKKDLKFIYKLLRMTIPVVCLFTLSFIILSPFGLRLLGGEKYRGATEILQILSVTIFFSFLNVIFGWPTLGVINRQNLVTFSTILSTAFNFITLLIFIGLNNLTLLSVSLVRVITELILFCTRLYYFTKYRSDFD